MTGAGEPSRDPLVVFREMRPALALEATRRLYAEQPALWDLGEHGRARTLEDFGHHLGALAAMEADAFRRHVAYCHDLFEHRGFPKKWLDDAWRILEQVVAGELPPAVGEPVLRAMREALAG